MSNAADEPNHNPTPEDNIVLPDLKDLPYRLDEIVTDIPGVEPKPFGEFTVDDLAVLIAHYQTTVILAQEEVRVCDEAIEVLRGDPS